MPADRPHPKPPSTRWVFPALVALTLAGAALRAWPLASRSLWHDEVMTIWGVDAGLWRILTWTHHYEHPPLSYLLVWLSQAALGSDAEWVVRLPSFLCGVLAIPAVFLLGRAILSPWLGLLAAAQAAFDLNAIAQGQQARMYTLTVLAALLTLTVALRAIEAPRAWWRWVAVGLGLAAAYSASHMGMMLWVALALGSLLLLLPKARPAPTAGPADRGRVAVGVGLAYAIAIALCGIGFAAMLSPERRAWFRDKPGDTPLAIRFERLVADWGHAYGSLPLALVVLAVGVVGLALLLRRNRPAALILLALILANLVLALPAKSVSLEPRPRYVIVMQIAVWIGVAHALLALRPPPLRAVGVAALAAVLAWVGSRTLTLGDHWQYRYGDVARLVRPRVAPGDAVITYPGWTDAVPGYYGLSPTHDPPPWGGDSRLAPAPFDALPTDRPTWLILAYHRETGATEAAPDMIAAVAERHGLPIDRDAYRNAIEAAPVVVARIDARGVVFVDLSSVLRDTNVAAPG